LSAGCGSGAGGRRTPHAPGWPLQRTTVHDTTRLRGPPRPRMCSTGAQTCRLRRRSVSSSGSGMLALSSAPPASGPDNPIAAAEESLADTLLLDLRAGRGMACRATAKNRCEWVRLGKAHAGGWASVLRQHGGRTGATRSPSLPLTRSGKGPRSVTHGAVCGRRTCTKGRDVLNAS
jgi:hypothetical protein